MGNDLNIALVSDLHVGAEEKFYFGINVRHNAELILKEAVRSNPDLLVLGGDLALDHGERPAYEWFSEQLHQTNLPIAILSGNHDKSDVLCEVLGCGNLLKGGELYYAMSVKGFPLFFLDSSTNRVSQQQLDWLVKEAGELSREALLFVHHPPTLCDARFMDDNWPLRNIDDVQSALLRVPNIRHIFSGHYHTTKTIHWEGRQFHLCPATQMQICEELEDFQVASYNPGWMSIRWDGESIERKSHFVQLDTNHLK